MSAPRVDVTVITGHGERHASMDRLFVSLLSLRCSWELAVSDFSAKPWTPRYEPAANEVSLSLTRDYPRTSMRSQYNMMARAAAGRWVVWVNDDAEVLSGSIESAIAFMRLNHEIGVGAFYYQEGQGTPWRVNDYLGTVYANFGIIERIFGDEIGWFGEYLFSYGIDNEICFRSLLHGRGVVGIPPAKIVHHIDGSARKECDSARHRPTASAYLQERYGPLMPRMKTVHDRYRHLGGPFVLDDREHRR